MTKDNNRKQIGEARIKFVAPEALMRALKEPANERNITLSALLRRITPAYVKRNNEPVSSQSPTRKEGWPRARLAAGPSLEG